ncbi:MAG: phosphoribosyltransferase family protein [Pseudomonadota bacterium]
MTSEIERALFERAGGAVATRGHFRYESGHHGDLWLDLDALLVDARAVQEWAALLAERVEGRPQIVCGPLTGGAFLAQTLAASLHAEFVYALRMQIDHSIQYRIPDPLRSRLSGRRVVVADDAVNAGSAMVATAEDVKRCGADLVGFASLIVLGDAAKKVRAAHPVPLASLVKLERSLWPADECPLCADGVPLADPPGV